MLSWQIFKQYIFSKRAGALIRTISRLSIFAIGVGIMALVVVLSIMNGFNRSIQNKLLAVEPHLVMTFGEHEYADVGDVMEATDWVESESLFETQDMILRTVDGVFGGAVAKGMEQEAIDRFISRVQKVADSRGREESLENFKLGPGEIMMGLDLARSLGVYEGEQLIVVPPETLLMPAGEVPNYQKVTLKTIIMTELPDVDSNFFYYALETSGKYFPRSSSLRKGFEIRINNPNDYEKYKTILSSKSLATGAQVDSWVDRNSTLFFALKMEKYAMTAFLGLSVLITSFSIITLLILLVTQKRRDIGAFMAMGLSPKKVRRIFVAIGLFLSLVGMGGGLVIGVILSLLIDRFPIDILPDIYYDATIPAEITPQLIGGVALFALVLAFFATWLPVMLNVRMSPAEALRSRVKV